MVILSLLPQAHRSASSHAWHRPCWSRRGASRPRASRNRDKYSTAVPVTCCSSHSSSSASYGNSGKPASHLLRGVRNPDREADLQELEAGPLPRVSAGILLQACAEAEE